MNKQFCKRRKIFYLASHIKFRNVLLIKEKDIDPAIYSRYVGSYAFQDGTAHG